MFSLMGNCVSAIKRRREPRRELTLAVLGLDNAGKTLATKGLIGELLETIPTVGFSKETMKLDKYDITLYDLGGGKKIRGIWKNYFAEVYGVVYVVDSSTPDRMEEAQNTLKEVLEHPHVSGKPVLILANKQDIDGALDEMDICEQLMLEDMVNMNKCPCRVEKISANHGTGKKMDPMLKEGMLWLCNVINHMIDRLESRVTEDMKKQEEEKKIEDTKKKERVRKIKEKREREEAIERQTQGLPPLGDEDDDVADGGDPFKKLDYQKLKKKDDNLKAKKKKKHPDFEDRSNNGVVTRDDSFIGSPKKGSSLRNTGKYDQDLHVSSHLREEDYDTAVISSHQKSPLPPLQQPLGTKFHDDDGDKPRKRLQVKQYSGIQEDVEGIDRLGSRKHAALRERVKTLDEEMQGQYNSDRAIPRITPRRNLESGEEERLMPRRQLPSLNGIDEIPKAEKPKKKKKLRNNKLAPSDDEYELGGVSHDPSYKKPLPWNAADQRSPRPAMLDSTTKIGSNKWGLAEDLPEISSFSRSRRPNMDDDDDIIT